MVTVHHVSKKYGRIVPNCASQYYDEQNALRHLEQLCVAGQGGTACLDCIACKVVQVQSTRQYLYFLLLFSIASVSFSVLSMFELTSSHPYSNHFIPFVFILEAGIY